jgi:hypothetical protein
MKCEKCDYEFNYNDPSGTKSYFVIEQRNEMTRGRSDMVAYCRSCAPFGNTKIPGKLE